MPATIRLAGGVLKTKLAHVLEELHVPTAREYRQGLHAAWHDGYAALRSILFAFWLTGRPVLLLTWLLLRAAAVLFYRHVIIRGVYQHGFRQAKHAAWKAYNFQRSLSQKQLALEGVLLASLYVLYRFYRFCQKRRYIARFTIWKNRQLRNLRKNYQRTVDRIARTSLFLAVMTPHALFFAWSLGVKLVMPYAVTYLATHTILLSLLRSLYPLMCTILLLHEIKTKKESDNQVSAESEGKENAKTEPGSPSKDAKRKKQAHRRRTKEDTRTPLSPSTSFYPRTSPSTSFRRSRRASLQAPLQHLLHEAEPTIDSDVEFWQQYWMTYAALHVVKQFVIFFPLAAKLRRPWLYQTFLQVELLFWLWIYVVPHLLPTQVGSQRLPECRPLPMLTHCIRPSIDLLNQHISTLISEEQWDRWVVAKATTVLHLFVVIKLMRQSTVDPLVQILKHSHGLVIPCFTLLMPSFVTRYGVLYVTAIFPLRPHQQQNPQVQLQYWVLFVGLSAVLDQCANILWWIPFSTHALLILWCYVCLPSTTPRWYGLLERELAHLGLLPGDAAPQPLHESQTAKLVTWVMDQLPRAQDEHVDPVDGNRSQYGKGSRGSSPDIVSAKSQESVGTAASSHSRGSYAYSDLSEIDEDDAVIADREQKSVDKKTVAAADPPLGVQLQQRRSTRLQHRQ